MLSKLLWPNPTPSAPRDPHSDHLVSRHFIIGKLLNCHDPVSIVMMMKNSSHRWRWLYYKPNILICYSKLNIKLKNIVTVNSYFYQTPIVFFTAKKIYGRTKKADVNDSIIYDRALSIAC